MASGFSSDLMKSLKIATAGMQAQNNRLMIISQNLAHANTRPAQKGEDPYRRKIVTFKTMVDQKTGLPTVKASGVKYDQAPFKKVYSPGDPTADAQGYVKESNVNPLMELADLREASRSHEANLRAYEKSLSMINDTISLLR